MSRFAKGKHVLTTALQAEVAPPGPGQAIVRALGSRGGNLVEVERPDGSTFFAVLPTRFHKRLWVKRGGYLIIDTPDGGGDGGDGGDGGSGAATAAAAAAPSSKGPGKVAGVIAAVLYDPDVRRLKAMAGVWPPEFEDGGGGGGGAAAAGEEGEGEGEGEGEDGGGGRDDGGGGGGGATSDSDFGLPPLEANPNQRRYDVYSEEEEEEEDEEN